MVCENSTDVKIPLFLRDVFSEIAQNWPISYSFSMVVMDLWFQGCANLVETTIATSMQVYTLALSKEYYYFLIYYMLYQTYYFIVSL